MGISGSESGTWTPGIKCCQNNNTEGNMAEYKFDREELRDRRGSKVAVLDGKYIRDDRGSKLGEIDGKYFRDSRGAKIAEFDGRDVRDSRGSKIATIDDVKKSIDGNGGASLVAMWLFFVR
jgi:sporulation protein YlmC with PRC-barrel domain